tara:strand:- start:230 stop:610 length:381 start_codon:yes stop_codon:yes gene_type:complete
MKGNTMEGNERVIEATPEELDSRVNLIRKQLSLVAERLRKTFSDETPQSELLHDERFRQWVISNLILDKSTEDEPDGDFNRLLYFMYEQCGRNIPELLSQYELDIEQDNFARFSFNLRIMETEFDD